MRVCVAGTFNVIHEGHIQLLKKAFEVGEEIFIGLTSDEMAGTFRDLSVQRYEEREKNLVNEVQRLSGGKKYHIAQITDVYGPVAVGNYDAIVVSEETKHKAEGINEVRRRKGLKELEIIVIKMVTADDGKPISSTRILRGEITPEGGPGRSQS